MILPVKAKNPPESFPYVTVALIAINVIVYAFTSEYGLFIRDSVVDEWALKGSDFFSIDLLTSMFLHGDLFHLLGNMWFLYLFGFAVEGRMKSVKFIVLYFVSGFCGDALHQLLVGIAEPDIPMLGASGAIMGVMGAAIFIFPHSRITVFYWFFYIYYGTWEWVMWAVGLFYIGFDVLWTLVGIENGVANLAHIGGAIGGFLIPLVFMVKRDTTVMSEAKASLSETKSLFALPVFEVQEIARSDPSNSQAALAWVWAMTRSGRTPTEECLQNFEPHVPALVRSGDVRELAEVLSEFGGKSGRIHPRYLVDLALRAEREAEAQSALRLLQAALANPHLTGSDKETALYQAGMVNESWFQNYGAAASSYKQVMDEFPGSPLADQAKTRYNVVEPLAKQSGSYKY